MKEGAKKGRKEAFGKRETPKGEVGNMPDMMELMPWIVIAFIVAVFYFIAWAVHLKLWIAAMAAGVPVSPFDLLGMRFRRVAPRPIIEPLIIAHKVGLKLTTSMLEAHALAGGHVDRVVMALVVADKGGIPMTWERATAIDLEGRDVYEAVMETVELHQRLVGHTGEALTDLHPAGRGLIDGRQYDVVTDADPIDQNETFRVVGVEVGRIVVSKA